MSTQPRPIFIYGTMCALPLLSWVLTGDASNVDSVSALVRQARVSGYSRFSLHNRDYPAAVKQDNISSSIDGYLLTPQTASQRRKLDDFEGEAYTPTLVTVTILDSNGEPSGETVDADMYVWNGDMEAVSSEPWDLDAFIRERLADWIDLFEGMELVGGDQDQ
ncbi:cd2a9a11-c406-497c-b1d9-ea9abf319348 [Thermothielavioides terrestris]|uniref:Putative gamma-glutamylcyclotransferase n=1 Tax=Thermothielavioides terrestris TaxID=2587410 RepID=A0A3S4F1H8_9PEZI|nr:cd2a9a11-c406-497c-b1d9-ea9abf319348 [Thermothielavioides terrestris]